MKISACYIVKNEEKNIARSLASIQDSVDEIIIVDTGSTDRTMDIVKKYAKIKLFQIKWGDDFAKARNQAISKATGDWIIFLDADEFFTEDTAGNIREIISKYGKADAMLVRLVNVDVVNNNDYRIINEASVLRIFRNISELRYVNKVHEELKKNGNIINDLTLIPRDELLIYHTGYSQSMVRAKSRQYLELLHKDIEMGRPKEDVYGYLASCYDGIGDITQALKYAYLDINTPKNNSMSSHSYRVLLKYEKNMDRRMEVLEKAIKEFPYLPEFQAEMAEFKAGLGNTKEAVQCMKNALRLYEQEKNIIEESSFDRGMAKIAKNRLMKWERNLNNIGNNTPSLTVCTLVKDEIDDLRKWIASVSLFADEIIIVGTAIDNYNAKEIAQAGNASFYTYNWQDDFAAARNFMLDKATCDWIAMLDVDERFKDPSLVREHLDNIISNSAEINAISVPIINIDEDVYNRELERIYIVRFFKNKNGFYYEGAIHEKLVNNNTTWRPFECKNMELLHTGYSTNRIERKLRRNLALMQKEMKYKGEEPYYRYLADTYRGLGDYKRALKYAVLAQNSPEQPIYGGSKMFRVALECMENLFYPLDEQIAMAVMAMDKYPQLPDFSAVLGLLLLKQNKLKDAEQMLQKSIDLAQDKNEYHEASMFSLLEWRVAQGLGEIYKRQMNINEARRWFSKALEINPYRASLLSDYVECVEDEEAILMERLEQLYGDSKIGMEFVLDWAVQYGDLYLYQIWEARYKEWTGEHHEQWWKYQEFVSGDNGWHQGKTIFASSCVDGLGVYLWKTKDNIPVWLKELNERTEAIVPNAVANALKSLQRNECPDFDGYIFIISGIMRWGTEDEKSLFLEAALKFSPEKFDRILDKLEKGEFWREMELMITMVTVDSNLVTKNFWREAGICFYHLGKYSQSVECLKRAVAAGDEQKKTKAYLHWLEVMD